MVCRVFVDAVVKNLLVEVNASVVVFAVVNPGEVVSEGPVEN